MLNYIWFGLMAIALLVAIFMGTAPAVTKGAIDSTKDTATNAMVSFMALNTAGIQLIPATIIGVLSAAGSKNPTAIIVTMVVATFSGAVATITVAKKGLSL
jgi:spore maturation protein A